MALVMTLKTAIFRLGTMLVALLSALQTTQAQSVLPQTVQQVVNAPEYKHSLWGILVVDAETGETLHEQNADKLFAPASVTKLFSVAAALEALGTDHRFTTRIVRQGEVDGQGVLDGSLLLLASGDLSLGGRTMPDGRIAFANNDHTYANGSDKGELTAADPLAGVNELARQVSAAGIRRVKRDVLIDDRLFAPEFSTGSGPSQLSPILVNDNLIDLLVTPTENGKPASLDWRPRTAAVRVDCRVETGPSDSLPTVTVKSTGRNDFVLTGRIPQGHKTLLRVAEVASAPAFARALLIEALERAGVIVDASPLGEQPAGSLSQSLAENAKLPQVAELASPPLAESARLILKVSHNLHASTLPLLLAAKSQKRTLAEGLVLQHDVLARLGVDVETISFGGGAGGSQADCVTPRATVQLLRSMRKHPAAQAYRDALPILGIDGTLAESIPADSPARGKVQAKTGTYYWENTMNKRYLLTSKALAGYLTSAKGRELTFALFVNRAHIQKPSDAAAAGKALGRIAEAIYLEY